MSTSPADIVNRALDALGASTIGDLQEGSKEAMVALRAYGPVLRQVGRAAHWNCLRKHAPLTLLQDASSGSVAMQPWLYEYAWPIDCLKVRYMPESFCAAPTAVPLTTGVMPALQGGHTRRARFLVTSDAVPNLVGQPMDWGSVPDTGTLMGQGLTSQTVILANQPNATLVYTALITYPDQWDSLFSEAVVAVLASRLALSLAPDKKAALGLRNAQIQIAKSTLDQARIADGNEGWSTVDHMPDWMRVRNAGGHYHYGGFGGELGGYGGGWDACGFGDGTAY